MGFTDEVGVGGGKPILKFNKEARYVKRGSEDPMNDQEFVAKIREARAGYIKFNGNDQPARQRDEWLKDRGWYDIITRTLDENWTGEDEGYIYDAG